MKTMFLIAASALTVAIATPAAAQTAWDGTGANDSVSQAQFGGEFSSVASGSAFISGSGITGAVISSSGSALTRINQGSGWNGNFANGATLLWNQGNAGDITYTFGTGVRGVGAQFQTDFFGPFTARITLNDGSFFDLAGDSNSNGDNSAIFIGAQNTIANILAITFHQQAGTGGNDFAISNLSLLTGAGGVPEPATWAMMIGGFGLVGGAMRRRSAKVSFA